MSVSIFSYNGRVTVGVMADAGWCPTPRRWSTASRASWSIARIGRPPHPPEGG